MTFERLIAHFENPRQHYEMHLSYYTKYEELRPGTILTLAALLHRKKQLQPDFIFKLQFEFFKNYPFLREQDMPLAKALYIEQLDFDPSFDPRASDMFFLMEKEVNFFNEFIDLRIEKYKRYFTAPRQTLTGVWAFTEGQTLVYDTLLKISDVKLSSIGMEDFGAVLFIHLPPVHQAAAEQVLQKFITAFAAEPGKLNMAWNILRNYLKPYYTPLIQLWLRLNSDFELFKKMDWTNHHFDYVNGIPSHQRIAAYQLVIDAIESMPDTDRFVMHQAYLQDLIVRERAGAEWEIKRIYRGLW